MDVWESCGGRAREPWTTRLVVISKSFSAVVLSANQRGLGKGADSESRQDVRELARDSL